MTKNTQGSELPKSTLDFNNGWNAAVREYEGKWLPKALASRENRLRKEFEEQLASSNQALLQKVREIVGEDVPTPSERTIKHIKENNPEELLKLIMWGNNAAHENALRAQIRTDLAKLEGEI